MDGKALSPGRFDQHSRRRVTGDPFGFRLEGGGESHSPFSSGRFGNQLTLTRSLSWGGLPLLEYVVPLFLVPLSLLFFIKGTINASNTPPQGTERLELKEEEGGGEEEGIISIHSVP